MKHIRSHAWIIAAILFLLTCCNNGKGIIPPGHPRVYLNPGDIPTLKQKTRLPEFSEDWQTIKELEHPFARAFVSLITEDEKLAAKAAIDFLPMLKKCMDARVPYNEMQIGACIYDWCYYQISDSLKQAYIEEFKRIAASHSPYYPAQKGHGVLVGHNTEGWILSDQLPAGVAIYDEDPEMYDSASVVFFDEFIPARNFVYQSHMHHQGDSYSSVRFLHDLFAAWLFRKMDVEAFSSDMQYVPYQLIYNYRPDGQQMRDGDTFDDAGNDSGGRSRAVNRKALTLLICGSLYDDPYQLEMFQKYRTGHIEKIFEFIITPVQKKTHPISELPLSKYFANPMAEIIARSGWDLDFSSNNAVIQMRIGNYFFGNHQTKDFGTFQIYFKGPLAIASGAYQGIGETYGQPHWLNYHHQTVSKNGLLIYDPNETTYMKSVNDGGQRWPNKGDDHPKNLDFLLDEENGYKMADVTAYAIDPKGGYPEYSYISGNITAAYAKEKVSFVERSMLTINTGDEDYPALFFVFDKVHSTKKEFRKTWLLHSIQEPQVTGDMITIVRDEAEFSGQGNYEGKLLCMTILPEDAHIAKIGGEDKGFWIESVQKNYFIKKDNPASEEGAWRVEVTPQSANEEDLFFHAMAVTNAKNSDLCDFITMNLNEFKGVKARGYAVLFNPHTKLMDEVGFYLDEKLKGVFIGGLKSGKYKILREEMITMEKPVSDESTCIFIQNARPGNYTLKRVRE